MSGVAMTMIALFVWSALTETGGSAAAAFPRAFAAAAKTPSSTVTNSEASRFSTIYI